MILICNCGSQIWSFKQKLTFLNSRININFYDNSRGLFAASKMKEDIRTCRHGSLHLTVVNLIALVQLKVW